MQNKNTRREAAALEVLALTSAAFVDFALPLSAQALDWAAQAGSNRLDPWPA